MSWNGLELELEMGGPTHFGKGLALFPWVPGYFPDRRMQDVPGPASSSLCEEMTSAGVQECSVDALLQGEAEGEE